MTNDELRTEELSARSEQEPTTCSQFVIRHSSFVIFHLVPMTSTAIPAVSNLASTSVNPTDATLFFSTSAGGKD
jgi:hypothetical protein